MAAPAKRFVIDKGWEIVIRDLGIDPADVLRASDLPLDFFRQPRPTLGVEEYHRVWKVVAELIGDPAYPLRLVEVFSVEAFSPPLFAALCSPNLGVALERLQQYKPLIGPMTLELEERTDGTAVRFGGLGGGPLPACFAAVELVFLVSLGRMATRAGMVPLRVATSTPLEALDEYETFFGTSVTTAERDEIVFARADIERPFLTVNPQLFAAFEPDLRVRLSEVERDEPLADRLRAVLMEALPSGQANMGSIARQLAMSTRSLQRKLAEEGTSFQTELATLRESLARHYLATSSYSSAEISFLLGYDDPNSFIRAFNAWTGTSPEATRAAVRVH